MAKRICRAKSKVLLFQLFASAESQKAPGQARQEKAVQFQT
jgi:hypothetical protein